MVWVGANCAVGDSRFGLVVRAEVKKNITKSVRCNCMWFETRLFEPLLEKQQPSMVDPLFLLFVTISLEISGTLLLKLSLNQPRLYFLAYLLYFASLFLFSFALRHIPLSIAYTTWCALGTVGVSVMSHILFDEALSVAKWICILLTIPCVGGLFILP